MRLGLVPLIDVTNFHADWYDNEHVPLRTSKFKTFLSAARYRVTSSSFSSDTDVEPSGAFQAKWAAIYTISSNSLFDDPEYTSLRSQRSEREGDLVKRLGVLDRRIYRLVYDSAAEGAIDISVDSRGGVGPAPADLRARTKAEVESAPYVVATSVTPAPQNKEAYDEWYAREHVGMLKKVPGWVRTRRYELIDALINGTDVKTSNGDGTEVPQCLGLHGESYLLLQSSGNIVFQSMSKPISRSHLNSELHWTHLGEPKFCKVG